MSSPEAPRSRAIYIVTAILGLLILIPSLLGFATKLYEFAHVVQGDPSGAFALTPIVNYLLASLGFLSLLVWASLHGMFHDIEAPKRTMLEHEALLDRDEHDLAPLAQPPARS